MGSGKTRLLEELRRHFNQDNHSIAIAITFNCQGDYTSGEEDYASGNLPLSILLSIFQRILRNVVASEAREYKKSVMLLDFSSLKSKKDLINFTRLFFQTLIVKLDVKKSLSTFILLVDEIMHVFNDIYYANPNFTMRNFEETLSILKSAVLDHAFYGAGGQLVNTTLVISSLDMRPLGYIESGRPIKALHMDSALLPEDIVSSWWLPSLQNIHFTNTDLFRLRLIASTICNMPRVVESVLPVLNTIVSGDRGNHLGTILCFTGASFPWDLITCESTIPW